MSRVKCSNECQNLKKFVNKYNYAAAEEENLLFKTIRGKSGFNEHL